MAASAAFTSTVALGQSPAALTAAGVIARIKANVGVPWREKTVDRIITGSADTPVRGIATTMMTTLEVVENSAAAGKNFIVTHEPTFYLHEDTTNDIANDPTLRYKLDFCKAHDITIFRFHDHWHAHRPDGIAQGMVHQLGWQKNVVDPADPKKLAFDGLTLAALAKQLSEKLHARTIRVLGNPNLPVHRVWANWGYLSRESGIHQFSQPGFDVLLCGEAREWEAVEYAQDTIRAGAKKGLIVIGHVLSEQGGMIDCADWLRTFIPEVPIQFIATPEPFWNALNPPGV